MSPADATAGHGAQGTVGAGRPEAAAAAAAGRSETPGTTAAAGLPARGDGGVLTRGTVTIDRERCKGCELCIPACRPGVLTMSVEVNAIGYRFPELAPGCTGCRACHAVCPDYVFEVYKYDEPVVLPAAEGSTEEGEG